MVSFNLHNAPEWYSVIIPSLQMRKLRHWPKVTQLVREESGPKHFGFHTVIFNIIIINKNNNTERIPVPPLNGGENYSVLKFL